MNKLDQATANSIKIELSLNADCEREVDLKFDLTDEDKEKALEAITIILYFTRKYVTDPTLRRIIEIAMLVLRSFI